MTIEELKTEAKKYGYHLIKDRPYVRFKPCTCGCNTREHISKWTGVESLTILRCTRCGREVCGKDETEAKLNWNAMIDCAWK